MTEAYEEYRQRKSAPIKDRGERFACCEGLSGRKLWEHQRTAQHVARLYELDPNEFSKRCRVRRFQESWWGRR